MAGGTAVKKLVKLHKKTPFKLIKKGFAYLQLQYEDAEKKKKPLPKGTSVKIYYVDGRDKRTEHSKNPVVISGTDGKISFKVEQLTNLTFEIEFDKTRYFNITKNKLMTQEDLDKAVKSDKLLYTKEMLFMLPLKMTPRNTSWEIKSDFYDTRKRYFKDLKTNQIKGSGGHLPLVLKPEWQYLAFKYFDAVSKKDADVPQGVMIEGYNRLVDKKVPVLRSNLYNKKCVLLPWIEIRNQSHKRYHRHMRFRFRTDNLFVESKKKIVEKKPEDIWKKPLKDRWKYFDIPENWVSSNWAVKIGSKWDDFNKMVDQKTDFTNPMEIYLDSVVLTNTKLERLAWRANDRFTVFDIQMKIPSGTEDTDKPYWNKEKRLKTNFITPNLMIRPSGTKIPPRVIALNGRFFDITHKRCVKNGAVGARAAVFNDKEVHHGQKTKEPMVKNAGNFELHYFQDCLDTSNNEAPYLMIYWSCAFKKKRASGYTTAAYRANRADFRKLGLANSKKWWEKNNYTLKRRGTNGKNLTVRPIFFFEGRERSPRKCLVSVWKTGASGRSNMGLVIANFRGGEHKKDASGDFTMAHELGHATGQDDEYLESLKKDKLWSPTLPRFSQFYPGMPYAFDNLSLMKATKDPRLRHFWYFCHWLNETTEIKAFTAAPSGSGTKSTTFQVEGRVGAVNYKYHLKNSWNNFYKPAYSQANFTNGTHGKMDLFLYKIGHDEATNHLTITGFDSILVVRVKLNFRFPNFSGASWGPSNRRASRLNYMRNFQTVVCKPLTALDIRFWIDCTTADDFKKVYVCFVPHYHYPGRSSTEHFEIKVRRHRSSRGKVNPSFYGTGFTRKDFLVDEKQEPMSIMRYILGLKPYKEVPVMKGGSPVIKDGKAVKEKKDITTISKADLGFLATWVGGKRSKTYTMKG